MRIFRFKKDDGVSVGIELHGVQFDCANLLDGESDEIGFAVRQGDTRTLIADNFFERAACNLSGKSTQIILENAELIAPIRNPEKIICIGLNYLDHCEEQNKPKPSQPLLFAKFANTIAGPTDDIEIPGNTQELDFEGEFGVVIGKTAKKVSRDDAMDFIFGYVAIHDVSARDLQRTDGQWVRAKSQDGFAPLGPYIVHKSQVNDPHDISIKTIVDGVVMQDGNTSNLIFGIPELIEFITRGITLEPGDIISTGTPAGVGVHRTPPVLIRNGTVVEVIIEGIGTVRNRFVSSSQ